MSKILFPTDMKASSVGLLHIAGTLTEKLNGSIAFYHSFQLERPDHRYTEEQLKKTIQEQKESLLPQLKQFTADFKAEVPVQHLIDRSDLIEGIHRYEHEKNIDWLILTYRKSKGFFNQVFGSRLEQIIEKSHAHMLILPDGYSGSGDFKRFAFTSKLTDLNLLALMDVDHLSKVYAATINFISIDPDISERDRLIVSRYEKAMRKVLDRPFHIHLLEHKNVPDAVLEWVPENDIDLLIMFKKHKGTADKVLRQSLVNQLLGKAQIPIILINERSVDTLQ